MADGIDITPGSGKTILTDDTGAGGHAQVFKQAYSADGVATLIGADANGLDVDVVRVPATTTKHKAYTQSATSALTTELNTLANVTLSAESAAIDNTSNLDTHMDLELVLGTQSARTAGAHVRIYMEVALDGTNYPDAVIGTSELVCVFPLDAATTARRCVRRDIPIPPQLFKLILYNASTQAFAASANTLKYRTHSLATT